MLADAALKELRARGIINPEQFLDAATPEAILDTCRWYDAQNGRVGTGVLVAELRAGGRAGWQPEPRQRDVTAEQRAYADEIVAWLREHFPEVDRPVYGPHPAAVAAVIRLHWVYGKGRLTVREHGPEICAAVDRWEEAWG